MTNVNEEKETELSIDELALQAENNRYKIGYAALRWAKEIKQKENLPEPIPLLIPRALREILTGKVSIEDVEKLPMAIKITQPAPQAQNTAPTPTITVTPPAEGEKKEEAAPAAPAEEVKAEEAAVQEVKEEIKEEKPAESEEKK